MVFKNVESKEILIWKHIESETVKKYKDLHISNTTNAFEGGVFSHMKNMISLHRRLIKSMKFMLVDFYLLNYKKK